MRIISQPYQAIPVKLLSIAPAPPVFYIVTAMLSHYGLFGQRS